MVSSSGICLCLFDCMSVLCFFLKALFVQTNYEKEQKMVPLFSEKTEVFGFAERNSILAAPETKAVFRQ